MAFALVKINQGRINQPEPEFLTVGSTAVTKGEALVLASGKLVAATGTTKPTFIAMADGGANENAPACRITPEMLWETTSTAAPATIGSKVTLDTDGAQVTNTTASGVATVVEAFGTGAGATVHVRFE